MRNPNRRLKVLFESHHSTNAEPLGSSRRLAPELQAKPMYVRCLLLIPKNLVYVFLVIICFAFAAMSYIAYTEKDLKEFLSWRVKEREEFTIHDMFKLLQSDLRLDVGKIRDEHYEIDKRRFNTEYLSQSRPTVVK